MTLRQSLLWLLVGIALTPAALVINGEAAGYVICHRAVEQAAPALVPAWDAVSFQCRATL